MSPSIESLWSYVAQHAPPANRDQIPALRAQLARLAEHNPHAALLCGQTPTEPLDQTRAQDLEMALLQGAIAYQPERTTGSRREDIINRGAAWLRLVYVALTHWNASAPQAVALTRLALVPRPQPSPFHSKNMAAVPAVEAWRHALQRWVRSNLAEAAGSDLHLAAIRLSAIVFGALLDASKVHSLPRYLGQPGPQAGGLGYLEFNLPYQGLGNHHIQRWYPDPLTALLMLNPQADHLASLPLRVDMKAIRTLLIQGGLDKTLLQARLSPLLEAAATWWQLRMAPLDLLGSQRTQPVHSVHPRTWQRWHGVTTTKTPFTGSSDQDRPEDSSGHDEAALEAVYPWLSQVKGLFEEASLAAAKTRLEHLMADPGRAHPPARYVAWLDYLLAGNSSTKRPRALATLKRDCLAALHALLSLHGERDPASLGIEELEAGYSAVLAETDPDTARIRLARGLREFHHFLRQKAGVADLSSLRSAFGEDAGLLPVDANLISFDDYARAQEILKSRVRKGVPVDQVRRASLIMTLAFRLGLRRREIWGLTHADISFHSGVYILIQPHPHRSLKTPNSKRMLPAHAFLSQAEQYELQAWLSAHQAESPPDGLPRLVFAHWETNSRTGEAVLAPDEAINRLIIGAIREATGDDRLFLHHLRHAFGTWTTLRLRAPDHPEVAEFFAEHPLTRSAIEGGAQLRAQLLGQAVVSRKYAFAVARLLGHSSPAVSLGHYLHGDDLIQAAIVQSEAGAVAKETLVAASGVSRTVAYTVMSSEQRSISRVQEARRLLDYVRDKRWPTPKPTRPRGRPQRVEAPLPRPDRATLTQVYRAYLAVCHEKQSPEEAAALYEVPLEIVARLQRATAPLPAPALPETPTRIRNLTGTEDKTFLDEIDPRLAELAMKDPALLKAGIACFLARYDRVNKDVVFKGEKDLDACAQYLAFVEALGFGKPDLQLTVRLPKEAPVGLPSWARGLERRFRAYPLQRIAPKNRQGASSYAKWLGVRFVGKNGRSIGDAAWMAMWVMSMVMQ